MATLDKLPKGRTAVIEAVLGQKDALRRHLLEMGLTPGRCTVVNAPLIEESPLCIECRVREILSLGSHDLFIADVVNVRADDQYLNPATGKFDLASSNPLVYVHGHYYELGEPIGKFGWSVEKKKNEKNR